eukprot:SAG11_NODE_3840_length_2194_cov_1.853461_1_plen_58_part_00
MSYFGSQAAEHDDFLALLERIRSKYRQLCAGLPLQAAKASELPLPFDGAGGDQGLSF